MREKICVDTGINITFIVHMRKRVAEYSIYTVELAEGRRRCAAAENIETGAQARRARHSRATAGASYMFAARAMRRVASRGRRMALRLCQAAVYEVVEGRRE